MEKNPFESNEYIEITKSYLYNIIEFLIKHQVEFDIIVRTKYIEFNPPLPKDIIEKFGENILLKVAGYTLESAFVDNENLYFEAGFGRENFGSKLTIPLLAIIQILTKELPIAINTIDPYLIKRKNIKEEKKEIKLKKSLNAILNNPENLKLLKKKKK